MTQTAQPAVGNGVFRPPPIESDPRAESLFGFVRAMVSNPISAIPQAAYSEPVVFRDKAGRRVGFVCDTDLVEEILVRRPDDFPKSVVDERLFRPAFGNSLLISQGSDWRWKRRLAAPHFTPTALSGHVPNMRAPFEALARILSRRNEKEAVDIGEAMTSATLEVITTTLFTSSDELDMAAVADAIADYLTPISWTISLASIRAPEWLPHPGRRQLKRGQRRMRELVADVVTRRRSAARSHDDICADLMAARDPETGKPLSDEDLVDMLLTLVAAGHETTANALTWALYCLACQPARLIELRNEVEKFAAGRPVEASDLPRLRKTEAFLKETMRLFPPAPIMARRTARREVIGGYECPAGMTLFIPIYVIHRHEAIWKSPGIFDPSRFMDEQAKRIPRTAYMPFGAGPRICIGGTFAMMEMIVALATLARAVDFRPSPETVCDPVQRVTLRPSTRLLLDTEPAGS